MVVDASMTSATSTRCVPAVHFSRKVSGRYSGSGGLEAVAVQVAVEAAVVLALGLGVWDGVGDGLGVAVGVDDGVGGGSYPLAVRTSLPAATM